MARAGDKGGSIVIVLATDASLSERQLRRLAARAAFGLGRAGSYASNASGEYALAFSTANRVPHRSEEPHHSLQLLRDDSTAMRELFEAAGDATQEAILNSLCAAEAEEGRDGHRAEPFPHELVPARPSGRTGRERREGPEQGPRPCPRTAHPAPRAGPVR